MLILLCILFLVTITEAQIKNSTNKYVLPNETIPLHYEITIEPFFNTYTFSGFVQIKTEIIQNTQSIVLHSNKITIVSVDVYKLNATISVTDVVHDEEHQLVTISVNEQLLIGDRVDISIKYGGFLNDQNEGFYRAKYLDSHNNESIIALTHMTSTYARQVFPCFDEPALKATFKLNIIRQSKHKTASNMELFTTAQLDTDRFIDIYKTTLKMSTYLLAFIVSEFSEIRSGNYSVYGRPEAILDGYGDYALNNSEAVMDAMETFTNISYSLKKIGMVAVPGQYLDVNAMENWGLVMFRERRFFYKANVSSLLQKQKVLSLIAHEYGHQWFGNLVTPEWWQYVWLSEGFATYCEYFIAHQVDPNLRMMEQFLPNIHQRAMLIDDTKNARPMTTNAHLPGDINRLFDGVAYEKSASVVRMAEHFLSTPIFLKGINDYLNKRAFSTSTPTDLFDSFQKAAEELGSVWLKKYTVHEIFNSWHTQSGYPYINATRDFDKNKLTLSQSRFYSKENKNTDELWYIPINFASASDPDFENTKPIFWLNKQEDSFELKEKSWIIINKKSTGYYRVNYDEDSWIHIISQLNENHTIINPLNRAQLIDDSFSLANAGIIDYKIPLALTEYITNETDYIPLTSYYNHITKLTKILEAQKIFETFKERIRNLLELSYETHSFNKNLTEHTMILNRIKIHNIMCHLGHKKCVNEMDQILLKSLSTGEKIHPDLQSAVYCGGMVSTNQSKLKWDKMWERYQSDIGVEEKTYIVKGFACSSEKQVLHTTLMIAANLDSKYKLNGEDSTIAISAVGSESYLGAFTSLEFILNNLQNAKLTTRQKNIMLRNINEVLFHPEDSKMLDRLANYNMDSTLAQTLDGTIVQDNENEKLSPVAETQFNSYFRK